MIEKKEFLIVLFMCTQQQSLPAVNKLHDSLTLRVHLPTLPLSAICCCYDLLRYHQKIFFWDLLMVLVFRCYYL